MKLAGSHPLVAQSDKSTLALDLIAHNAIPSDRQRLAMWIGAGLAGGLALAALTPRQWSRLGALVFGAGAWMLRSPIGPALVAAVLARATAHMDDERVIIVEAGQAQTDA